MQTQAPLPEENRSGTGELDGQGNKQHQRGKNQQKHKGSDNVQQSLGGDVQGRLRDIGPGGNAIPLNGTTVGPKWIYLRGWARRTAHK